MTNNEKRNYLNNILKSKDIRKNQETLFEIIPELKAMRGFEHKHPHHHLDVWQHTLLVVDNLEKYEDLELLMSGLLHDIGKPYSYQDEEVRHFHGHPEVSEKMAGEILNRLEYEKEFVENVCYLIKNHDKKIEPDNLDNSIEMVKKLLKLQFADARAHHPDKVKKRIDFLNDIKKQLEEKKLNRNGENR